MSFRSENERRGPFDRPPDSELSAARKAPEEEGGHRRLVAGPPGRWLVPLIIVGVLLLALVVGAVLLWFSYGDRAGGTSVFEDSVESGPEPVVRLANESGRVSIEGVEGLERVEISAKRYARGFNPPRAKENAAGVPVDIFQEGSNLEISSGGGRGTGTDYDVRVPPPSVIEVESATGDVEVSGLTNDVMVRAEGGDVTVENIKGSIEIEAPQGDVTVESASTETGNAGVMVGSGDVTLTDLVVGIMETRVEAGDVTLSGRFSGSGRVFVETGSISVKLPPEDVRELDLQTRVGEVVREQGSE